MVATGCQTPSDYYRINVYYPFIDHVVEELDTRFTNEHKGLVAVQHLVPANLNNLTESDIDNISTYHGKFFSSMERINIPTEIIRWKKNMRMLKYNADRAVLLLHCVNAVLNDFQY